MQTSLNIAWAGLHFGEEPPITRKGGSGTIFVSGCNLGCSFCQNYQISHEGMGTSVSTSLFSCICLRLEKAGAENINIVTGSHHTVAIARGLEEARKNGMKIPILWNTSAYEKIKEVQRLSNYVDIWLPDLKTLDSRFSLEIFRASDYPKIATDAILKMAECAPLKYENGSCREMREGERLVSGVIVRYLLLPNCLTDAENLIKWFSNNLKEKALLSIMTQYTPIERDEKKIDSGLDRYVAEKEDEMLKELLYKYDVEDGFYQELLPDSSWLPDFYKVQPFSSALAKPIWHWSKGFV